MTGQWIAHATKLPVAFAQVREDSRVDLAVLDRLGGSERRGVMIASGGCTAAALVASSHLSALDLVDANPAQLALTRLKLYLLEHVEPGRRRTILGHTKSLYRRDDLLDLYRILGLAHDALGPLATVADLGPDHAGRYEVLFAQLRLHMRGLAREWPTLLTSFDPAALVSEDGSWAGTMDDAFNDVMALDNLVKLFGRAATQNAVRPFCRHFARQTRLALAQPDAAHNPFLWQLLVGRFPLSMGYDWLTLPASKSTTRVTFTHAMMGDKLASASDEYDFVHLSNILDWLTPGEAADVLKHAYQAMKPGGLVVIRQLNSTLDLPTLGPQFEWLSDEADALHAADRSFFYRRLHLGRRA